MKKENMNMQKRHMYGTATALAVTGLLGLGNAVNADPVMPSSPVSGWTFDGNLEDAFGGNDGEAPNGIVYVNDGPFGGQALDLSGNTGSGDAQSYVNIGNPESLQLTTNMTVATWVRTDRVGGNQYPLAKFEDGQKQWAIGTWYSDQRLLVSVSENGIDTKNARPANDIYSLDDNEWHHLAFTLDEEDGLTLYIDGAKVEKWHTNDVSAITNPVTEVNGGSANITVGALSDLAASTFFQGQIGETAIWDQVLSDDEIAWLSQNSFAVIPEPGSLGLLGTGAFMVLFRRRK